MEIERKLILRIRKIRLELFGHILRKEGLESLTVTGHTEGKRDTGRKQATYLTMKK